MAYRSLTIVLAVSVILAGCTAGPIDLPGENATSGEPPGITNGRLTNSSALIHAHETSLNETGFATTVTQSINGSEVANYDVVATAGLRQYTLSGTRSAGGNRVIEMGLWANESHRVAKYQSGDETRYHASQRGTDPFDPFGPIGGYIRAGNFTVNETTGDGYTVLTASEPNSAASKNGHFKDITSVDGRAVVDEEGRIHELSVTVEHYRGTETYSFDLQRTNVTSVDQPAWFDEVPPGAFLSPQLSIDIEDESVLTIRNEGNDAVPANTTLILTMDNTTYRAKFDNPLEPGDVQYAAIAADDGTLQLTAEQPPADDIQILTSPISVTVETSANVTLYSGGMGWGGSSESGSEEASGESTSSENSDSASDSESG